MPGERRRKLGSCKVRCGRRLERKSLRLRLHGSFGERKRLSRHARVRIGPGQHGPRWRHRRQSRRRHRRRSGRGAGSCSRLPLPLGSARPARRGKARDRPRLRQRLANRIPREIVHELRMPETHFDLRRMHVHVHFLARQFDKQQRHRKHVGRQNISIRLVNGVQQQPVPHQPAVHENIDAVAVRSLHFRPRNKSAHGNLSRPLRRLQAPFWICSVIAARIGRRHRRDLHHLLQHLPPKELIHALGQRRHRRRVHDLLRRRLQRELLVRIRQRVMRHQRSDVPQFGGLRFQEFSARRNAVKQIGHAHRSARGQPRRFHAQQLAPGKLDPRALLLALRARFQQQPRYRSDRRQRLAAKSQRGDGKQVVRRAQLRSGVPLERQQRIVVAHPAAVVHHADHALAAGLHFDAHRPRPGIQRVFEQLLHHRRRPLHHLARGDAVGYGFRQYAYARHSAFRCQSET